MGTHQLFKQLRREGFRLTNPRRAIVRVLEEADEFLTPDQIMEQAGAYYQTLSLATVYRTLSLLSEQDFIRRIHLDDGCHGYARADLDHGHHLVCRKCSRIIEFQGLPSMKAFITSIENETGFTIEDHVFELVGLCPSCKIPTCQSGDRNEM